MIIKLKRATPSVTLAFFNKSPNYKKRKFIT